jgi:hypothetical protein
MSMGSGAAPALGLYKVAVAYQVGRRFGEAQAAYDAAARADRLSPSGGRQLLHLIYQGMASLALQQEKFPDALRALDLSTRASQDSSAPYRFRLDVARQLLRHGYEAQVAAYCNAALEVAPDDDEAKALLADAKAAATPR